jgi:hypothetical protein
MHIDTSRKTAVATICLLVGLSSGTIAGEPTGFDLIREGNRYVGEQAKDKVVRLRSEKSVGGLVPNIWVVTYYDSTATFKATEVKFGAGKMLDVSRPIKLLVPITGTAEPPRQGNLEGGLRQGAQTGA